VKDERLQFEFVRDRKLLLLLGKALSEYARAGKTLDSFESDYGCTIIFDEFDEVTNGIQGVSFHSDSNQTAFMLKYDT